MKTFPYERKCPFVPSDEYLELMREPVSRVTLSGTGLRVWVVTRYEDIRKVLTDPRLSASRQHANFPFYFDPPPEFRTETSFIGYDPPEHTTLRRKAALSFTHRNVQRLRPRIQQIVDEHVDAMLAMRPPVDFHRVYSLSVAMSVISELLGVPRGEHDFFIRHGEVLLGGTASHEERRTAIVELNNRIERLIRTKEQTPGDDLLSRVIADYRASGEEYSTRELFNMFRLLMNGGHETTASMMSLGTACLLDNPDQLAELLADPENVIGPAVEELLRMASISDNAVPRVAMADIEIGGQVIPKGDGILCLILAGNRDPDVFPEPDRMILTRGSRRQLGFGHGAHFCIGADLARLEMRLSWTTLFRRIPTLRLVKPFDEIPRKEGAIVYGLRELPLTWDEGVTSGPL
jgi:cytochrome P450